MLEQGTDASTSSLTSTAHVLSCNGSRVMHFYSGTKRFNYNLNHHLHRREDEDHIVRFTSNYRNNVTLANHIQYTKIQKPNIKPTQSTTNCCDAKKGTVLFWTYETLQNSMELCLRAHQSCADKQQNLKAQNPDVVIWAAANINNSPISSNREHKSHWHLTPKPTSAILVPSLGLNPARGW